MSANLDEYRGQTISIDGKEKYRIDSTEVRIKGEHYLIMRARDLDSQKDCFLKISDLSQFSNEEKAHICADLEREANSRFYYPYITRIYGEFRCMINGREHIGVSSEYIEGADLEKERSGLQDRLSHMSVQEEQEDEIRMLRQIRQFLHAMNYYLRFAEPQYRHRDLKPQNIRVLRQSGDIKIIDFDAAHVAGSTGTQCFKPGFHLKGTAGYAIPSLFEGKDPGEQGDIYAAGRTLCFWLNGKRYFEEEDRGTTYDQKSGREDCSPKCYWHVDNEELGYGLDPNRFLPKYSASRFEGLLKIIRNMCGNPKDPNTYTSSTAIMHDYDAYLMEYSGGDRKQFLKHFGLRTLGDRVFEKTQQVPNVGCIIDDGAHQLCLLHEYQLRDIRIDGTIVMTLYNRKGTVFYIPAIDCAVRRESGDNSSMEIADGDGFVVEKSEQGKTLAHKLLFTVR